MQSQSQSNRAFDLIVTIVNRGVAEDVIEASREAGAEGGTVVLGRGIGVHDKAKFLGIPVEPAKDIVLTVTPEEKRIASWRRSVRRWIWTRPVTGSDSSSPSKKWSASRTWKRRVSPRSPAYETTASPSLKLPIAAKAVGRQGLEG